MTSEGETIHVGGWTEAWNQAADMEGSIHDDEAARERGFPGGLVPGNLQLSLAQRALVETLGSAWYERGWLSFRWVSPVYAGEEMRVILEEVPRIPEDERSLTLRVERRDGGVLADGGAGLGPSRDQILPPWERRPAPLHDSTAPEPLPEEPLGVEFPTRTIRLEDADVVEMLAEMDPSPWYSESSPWGRPILPAVAFLAFTGQGHHTGPVIGPLCGPAGNLIHAGMNGTLELVQTGPLFPGRSYERRAVPVEKGRGARTCFRILDIRLSEPAGRRVAHARWKEHWFPESNP
jgi:hypothetical protein